MAKPDIRCASPELSQAPAQAFKDLVELSQAPAQAFKDLVRARSHFPG